MTGPARHLWSNESGATVIEHAILACLLALAIVAVVGSGLTPTSVFRGAASLADSIFPDDKALPSISPNSP